MNHVDPLELIRLLEFERDKCRADAHQSSSSVVKSRHLAREDAFNRALEIVRSQMTVIEITNDSV